MPTFIEKSNCRGSVPTFLSCRSNTELRPHILAAMLAQRDVARIIVGPAGYGKTNVACEYCQMIFSFKHTFWICADSPCFLRDLDNEDIAENILKADSDAKIVVFDDVPSLDDKRLERFSSLVDDLLDEGCEVIATCIPSADSIVYVLDDPVLISPYDLLLTDDELEVEKSRGNEAISSIDELPLSMRAPSMVFDKSSPKQVLEGISKEILPAHARFLIFSILLLEKGDISEISLSSFIHVREDDILYLESRYPFLGIDTSNGSFRAVRVECNEIKLDGKFSISQFISVLENVSYEEFAIDMAQHFAAVNGQRACAFVKEFVSSMVAGKWLVQNGWNLVFANDALSVIEIARASRKSCAKLRYELDVYSAWALAALGDVEGSRKLRNRLIASSEGAWSLRCTCAILAFIEICSANTTDAPLSATGAQNKPPLDAKYIFDLLDASLSMVVYDGDDVHEQMNFAPLSWQVAFELCHVLLECICKESDRDISEMLCALVNKANDPKELTSVCFCAALFLRAYDTGLIAVKNSQHIERLLESLSDALDFLITCEQLENSLPERIWLEVAKTVESFAAKYMPAHTDVLSQMASNKMDILYLHASELARSYRKQIADMQRKQRENILTLPDSPRHDKALSESMRQGLSVVPTLDITMFGGFDARIGDRPASSRILSRKKAKIALAILMLSKGREVSKDRVTQVLWPDSPFESRQKNFYVVWSDLKKALSLDGYCPYLIRTQTGYKLDSRYVASDLDAFDELCHNLLFGSDDTNNWRDLFDKASKDYAEDLLPGVTENEYIEAARIRCRTQLVDGLVAAAIRMNAQGEYFGAIWFAREATKRDATREDAYIALMEAHISADQRALAIEEFFKCKHNLSEQLGIDPSKRIVDLYRSIIETEETF